MLLDGHHRLQGDLVPSADKKSAPSIPSTSGAVLGPAGPPHARTAAETNTLSAPSSPYFTQRAAIRDLTLPANPNLNIPPSPPGSPAPGTERKIVHFLELKKQGVHFNTKLASSSALKNPSLLPKLMQSAGVENEKQYSTTLPERVWDPVGLPRWAYKEELGVAQQETLKRKEEERANTQRESIDFVSANTSGPSSRGGTPEVGSVGTKGMRGSAAERVMAGLDREKKVSSHVRSEPDGRGGRNESTLAEGRSKSHKRPKRSGSR